MKKGFLQFVLPVLFLLLLQCKPAKYEIKIPVTSPVSMMRIGIDPHPHNEDGQKAAILVWDGITGKNRVALDRAIHLYDSLLKVSDKITDFSPMKWICEGIQSGPAEGYFKNTLDESYFRFFTDNNYEKLKEYLERKYKIGNFNPDDPDDHLRKRTFLEDLMMFNNPSRNDWENTSDIIKNIPLEKGLKVLDIGSGFGFYSFRFAEIVGETGKVYAIDTEEEYVKHFQKFVNEYHISNISPVVSKINDVVVTEPVDLAYMSSVYHIIYGWNREMDRAAFFNSLKRTLRKDGWLVISDNSFLNGNELNNCYVNKELAIAQLIFNGFDLIRDIQITPKRYMLIFRHRPGKIVNFPVDGNHKGPLNYLNITSGNSIIHIGSLDSYDITPEGIAAARLVRAAFEKQNADSARAAISSYATLIPKENFGGEYSALQWFCEYLIAGDSLKSMMLKDPLVQAYHNYFAKDNYLLLREYVNQKYRLAREERKTESKTILREEDREIGRTRRAFLEDVITFNNPKREEWEKSSVILAHMNLKPGDVIADIGCGSGYFSYRFSKLVGPAGMVYSMDTKQQHIDFLNEFIN
ncbi:MAG TPA: class I SAM-dependent methyltransferase, partial [Bacteroidales bacterium]|nr:class I SAM-dependent methyltransferase [Bacteroidales bacterium]